LKLTLPANIKKKLPLIVLIHGSGHNDMNETLPDGAGEFFVPIAQTANRDGFAVLRLNKRGVTDVGPVLTKDQSQLDRPKPYEQIKNDAATVTRFGAALPEVDASRIFLIGHSEGAQVASDLAADPAAAHIPKPAGVIAMAWWAPTSARCSPTSSSGFGWLSCTRSSMSTATESSPSPRS
jgi:poly(3-hydroxybutyrate) depolymerase